MLTPALILWVKFVGRPNSFVSLLRNQFKVHFLRETQCSGFWEKTRHQNNNKQANKPAIFSKKFTLAGAYSDMRCCLILPHLQPWTVLFIINQEDWLCIPSFKLDTLVKILHVSPSKTAVLSLTELHLF